MKYKLLLIAFTLIIEQAYASKSIYSEKGNFRIPLGNENVETFETGSYNNLLRMVDEINRKKGISSNYINKNDNKSDKIHDNVNIVPIAQFVGTDGREELKEIYEKQIAIGATGYQDLHNLITKKEVALYENNKQDSVSYTRSGNQKRFYFGNGNTVNDIIIEGTENFNKTLDSNILNKTDKYILEGEYKSIGNMSALGISMDDYYNHIEGKSRTEVAKYLSKNKYLVETMKEKGYSVIEKDGELYTKKGDEEWKILWDLEAVSIHQPAETDKTKAYKDEVRTRVYTYETFDNPNDSKGRMLYTKNGDIIVEDKLDHKMNIQINTHNGENPISSLDEIIKKANTNSFSAIISENEKIIKQYFEDKKNLSTADFESKWITPFGPGSTFEQDIKNYDEKIKIAKEELEILEKKYKEVDTRIYEIIGNPRKGIPKDPQFPRDYYKGQLGWISDTEEKVNAYLNSLTEYQRNLVIEYYQKYELRKKLHQEKTDKEIEVAFTIPEMYGLNPNSPTADGKKWVGKYIKDSHILLEKTGKNIEFRGRGRIEGTIDLGEGENELSIIKQASGRYGTNIILGPNAKLINVKFVKVGGNGVGNNSKVSLTGRTSLTLDLDPNKKNSEGHLYQHALKNSDPNIIFIEGNTKLDGSDAENFGMHNRNNFEIELMTSKISEDSTINMGRKIDYEFNTPHLSKKWNMTIPFISDSIAHSIIDNKEFAKDGNSLLNVKIKDNIKRLSESENAIYKSIKDAKVLGILHPTLTATNKKTKFSVEDEMKEKEKQLKFFQYLKTKNPEEVLNELSQFNLDENKKNDAIKKIENLKKSNHVVDSIQRTKDFEQLHASTEYKSANLNVAKTSITHLMERASDIWLTYDEFENKDVQNQDERKRIEKQASDTLLEVKRILNNTINIENLKVLEKKYPSINFSTMINQINDINSLNTSTKEGMRTLWNKLAGLEKDLDKNINYEKYLLEELKDYFEGYNTSITQLYKQLKSIMYYTTREEEALSEFKTLLSQLQDTNIYSKVNKIAKNELTTYTNIPFEINRSLSEKKHYARGGFISARTAQNNFKGNTYTAYGLYENKNSESSYYGFMLGGANTNHELQHTKRSAKTTPTLSTVKGTSIYLGGYWNQKLYKEIDWISGIGVQHGSYKVNRDLKNNYQSLTSNGKLKLSGLNTYTGLVVDYPLQEDVIVQIKGILSYSFIHQGKVSENEGLNLDINSKNYHYIDGELGVNFRKTLYDDDRKSSLSAGIYGISGLVGYKNDNLNARISGSSSSFEIKGDRTKKDAIKLLIDYNVQTDEGYNYGLEGTYISNSEENNVKIGIKAGYVF